MQHRGSLVRKGGACQGTLCLGREFKQTERFRVTGRVLVFAWRCSAGAGFGTHLARLADTQKRFRAHRRLPRMWVALP